jgi:tRNA (guanine-N7-)-methyltransferase
MGADRPRRQAQGCNLSNETDGAASTDRGQRRPYRLFGRKLGRPLRAARQTLVETLLPRISVPADAPIDPAALFGDDRPVWLEIGFGGGEHLAWQAAANPDVGLIGAEPYLNGVAAMLAHVETGGLVNVRLWPDDARMLLDRFAPQSLSRVFILFPDPWRKSRHADRRLVSRPTLDRLAVLMRPGAELRLASDDPLYRHWMLDAILHHPDFAWTATGPDDWNTRPDDWPETRYEAKAHAAGRKPLFLRLVRR